VNTPKKHITSEMKRRADGNSRTEETQWMKSGINDQKRVRSCTRKVGIEAMLLDGDEERNIGFFTSKR
jgi:hypothetical protein